jgi:O-antigen/teichoic acid export membrane protein
MLPQGLAGLVPVGLASFAFGYSVKVLLQVMRAANRSTSYAILSVAATLLGTALSVYLVWGPELGAFGILAGAALGNLLLLPFGISVVRKEGHVSPSAFDTDVVRDFTSYGFPLVPAAISTWLLVLADRYVIGAFQGVADVGLYSVAYGLGDKVMNLIILPLTIAMAPVMVQTFEQHGQEMAQRVQTQFTRYFAMATLPFLFGMAAIGQEFMAVFTGEQYRSAYPILPIVAASVLMNGLTQIAGNGLALHKKSTIMMSTALTAAGFNVATNLLLVPRFGYMAAAYTTFASYLVLLGLTWYRSRPYMAWRLPFKGLLSIVAASASMFAVIELAFASVEVSAGSFLAQVGVGFVLYVAALFAFGGVRADERELITELWRRLLRKKGDGS